MTHSRVTTMRRLRLRRPLRMYTKRLHRHPYQAHPSVVSPRRLARSECMPQKFARRCSYTYMYMSMYMYGPA